MFRVSAHQVGARTVSVLSIASSLAADSGGCYSVSPHCAPLSTTAGNYTCALPGSELSATLEISIHQARGEAAHCTLTLVTSCLARNNNTNHEYFIRQCLQNYIKLANGSSLVGQLALPSANQIITEI